MIKNNENSGNLKLFVIKPSKLKEHDGKNPFFSVLEKNPDGYKKIQECSGINGKMTSIKFNSFNYNGKNIDSVSITFCDFEKKENYLVDLNWNNATRSLFNSILSADPSKDSDLNIYRNKDGYVNYGLIQDGKLIKWKFNWKDLPEVTEVKHPETGEIIQRDYKKINSFLQEKLIAFSLSLKKEPSVNSKNPVNTDEDEVNFQEVEDSDEEDDIPF